MDRRGPLRRSFAATPAAVPAARSLVVAACGAAELPERADVAALLVTEVMANAIRYARDLVTVDVAVDRDRLTISVADDSAADPVVRRPAPLDERGRGMLIVDMLADRWGTNRTRNGKVVWFSV